jgi:hypothetical protein
MDALIAIMVSAVTSVMVALVSVQFASRQQRRSAEHAEQKEINARYLNPLRFQVADNHYRLWDILSRKTARDRMLFIDGPEEISPKDWEWFNGPGNYFISSAYMMACMFTYLHKVREDVPYLRLSSADDTTLVELILKLQITLVKQEGVQYVVQTSTGQNMWLQAESRLLTYREFCELLRAPGSRVWLDRIFKFYLEIGRGLKTERSLKAISAMENLAGFLDRCVGGGGAIASRWAAEGKSPDVIKLHRDGDALLDPQDHGTKE